MQEDARSAGEKAMWDIIGPPLYYCEHCLLAVSVQPKEGLEPAITKRCGHDAPIIAPRRSILAGEGGLNFVNKVKMAGYTIGAKLTGRSV